jgi:hypothetical protein
MRSLMIFYGIFATIGSIAACVMVFTLYSSLKKNATWTESTGTITRLSDNPIITFDYYGAPKEFRSSFSSSNMKTGDEVTVYFPAEHPEDAEIKSFFTLWFIPLFSSVFALSFGGLGYYGVSTQLRRYRAKRDLFSYGKGRKTTLPVTSIAPDSSFTVNGRNPYIILCQHFDPVSNKIYEFKSDYIWYDPTPFLKDRKEIDIYVDPNDMRNYYMDSTFLPAKA